jgi:hypothetical protein
MGAFKVPQLRSNRTQSNYPKTSIGFDASIKTIKDIKRRQVII